MTERNTILEVDGMHCPSCIDHISSTLAGLSGVGKVDVLMDEGAVVVEHDVRVPVGRLISALAEAGYDSKQR